MIDSLVLNIQHRAFLASTPEKWEQTRWEYYKAIGSPLVEVPDVEECAYLIDYLMGVGPVNQAGMGISPITYTDIRNWSDITDSEISGWDAHMIRHLSRVYVNQYNESKDPQTPAPYEQVMDIAERRKAVVAGFKNLGKRNNG